MTTYLQGLGCKFGECFSDGNEVIYLQAGCITEYANAGLCFDHSDDVFGKNCLEIYIGDDSLAFRYELPASWEASFMDQKDELTTYVPVSVGPTITESKTVTIDGQKVKIVLAAKLNEISIVSTEPAIKSTYGRIVSAETCNSLKEDYEAGRLQLVGSVIGLHRKVTAADNGGVVKYAHSPSNYDRAADKFTSALMRLS